MSDTQVTHKVMNTTEHDGDFVFTGTTIRRAQQQVPTLIRLTTRKILACIESVPTLLGLPEVPLALRVRVRVRRCLLPLHNTPLASFAQYESIACRR